MDKWHVSEIHAPETPFVEPSMRKWLVGFFGASYVDFREEGRVRRRIQQHLELLYRQGHRHFFVGMCEGFSLLVMEEILTFRQQHTPCYLFLLEPQRQDTSQWTREDRDTYEAMRVQVDQVISVSVYHDCKPSWVNRRLLNYCGRLVYYPGFPGGNTEHTVKAAEHWDIYVEQLVSRPVKKET